MRIFIFALFILSLTASSSAFTFQAFRSIFSSKTKCPVTLYDPKDSSFTGVKLYSNEHTFQPLLRTLSKYAKECRVKINVKQAFIKENSGLPMIHDHTDMAFRLGEAIEFELLDEHKKLLCNRVCLNKGPRSRGLSDANCFLEKLSKNHDFRQDALKPNLLIRRPKRDESLVKLQEKRKDIQNECKKLKLDA